jgi:ribosomal protein S18 acetylase RimI-like enzyme
MSDCPGHIRPATRGDLPEILDLLVACDVATVGVPDTDAGDIEGDWNLAGFDLSRDTWLAEGPGGVVGYAYTGDQLHTGELECDVWVHPAHEEPELLDRLLGLAERRGREVAGERGYRPASLAVFCISLDHTKRDVLARRGYGVRRTIYRMGVDLTGDIPVQPPPDGIAIRPFKEDQAAAMHDTMEEAFADHFRQSKEPFEAWKLRLLGHPGFDPDLWAIAWDGDEPAGALICFDYDDLAYVQGLAVRRPWRRRGLGLALLTWVFGALAARGQVRVELGVDAEGKTQPLRLYERAGMHVTFTYELFGKELAGG